MAASSCFTWCAGGCGLAMAYIDPTSRVPMIGASGAISGVLAAYVLLYPRARVTVIAARGIILESLRHCRHVETLGPLKSGPRRTWHGVCFLVSERQAVCFLLVQGETFSSDMAGEP
jgi:membrane associated rhomboid family serine protease